MNLLGPACLRLRSHLTHPCIILRRRLSSAEVSTALRPFYFLVHPDLFGRFPDERAVNERSLKSLRAYVDELAVDRRRPPPIRVKFYLRPVKGDKCKMVSFTLDASSVRQTLATVLTEVHLPTSYIDSIPQRGSETVPRSDVDQPAESIVRDWGEEQTTLFRYELRPSTDTRIPLATWLADNVQVARERIEHAAPLVLRLQRMQDEVRHEFGLADIQWDCDLLKEHRLATLSSFRQLVLQHLADLLPVVRDRTVVFGRYSGVSLDGHIVLFSGEVRSNWLRVLHRAYKADATLRLLPHVERALSRAMRDVQVVRRANQPITLVDDYRSRLRQLLTTIGDIKSKGGFPPDWPESLSSFRMCVETAASPLMLSPEGIFIVPSNCPGFLLTDFISENLREAGELASAEEGARAQEEEVRLRCAEELGLIELTREDGVAAASMMECCARLREEGGAIRHLTHGNSLMVANYYAVLADGVICIPWDWVAEEEE